MTPLGKLDLVVLVIDYCIDAINKPVKIKELGVIEILLNRRMLLIDKGEQYICCVKSGYMVSSHVNKQFTAKNEYFCVKHHVYFSAIMDIFFKCPMPFFIEGMSVSSYVEKRMSTAHFIYHLAFLLTMDYVEKHVLKLLTFHVYLDINGRFLDVSSKGVFLAKKRKSALRFYDFIQFDNIITEIYVDPKARLPLGAQVEIGYTMICPIFS